MKLTREHFEKASDEELREWVAEYVMGMVEQYVEGQFGGAYVFVVGEPDGNWISKENIPHYSTDIAAAWQVVDKMTGKNLGWKLYNTTDNNIGCHFEVKPNSGEGVWATADTAPRAICKAALLAMV